MVTGTGHLGDAYPRAHATLEQVGHVGAEHAVLRPQDRHGAWGRRPLVRVRLASVEVGGVELPRPATIDLTDRFFSDVSSDMRDDELLR